MSGNGLVQRTGAAIREGWEAVEEAVDEATKTPGAEELKTKAGYVSLAATVIAVALVAGAVIALVSGILTGGVLAGVISFTACAIFAMIANDVRVIADKISNGGIQQFATLLACDNPLESICANAAKNGTVILKPSLIHWIF